MTSDAGRERLRRLVHTTVPMLAWLEGAQRGGLIDVDERIELPRQLDVVVVTLALCLRTIDDADGALNSRL